ncbi:uncharacterized protein LOC115625484 [Scaptodrosophila lebanonensis]|uniref:Uncharacterized protein LOC115625484 n=1 Tax=Drosophila lebanonensis TaxID=7225 RepID=A0A6J2TN32_DROLE|nr:uncharacterized protein LOC115625484 [Scaptodrosophila lebanonensis]
MWSAFDTGAGKTIIMVLVMSMARVSGICLPPHHCIEDMDESDVKERYDYVLSKYEEVQMKIAGQPIGLHGKVVSRGNVEEQHIVFQYQDNQPHDVIQSCAFVITNAPDTCESILTICNTFLPRTPRPLLMRKPLTVCEDGVRETEAQSEDTTEGSSSSQQPDAELANDSEFI